MMSSNSKAELSTLQSSLMTQNQLVDALTSHISLYHSHSQSRFSSLNPNPNPRSAILKWFSSLSLHHRRAHLTAIDAAFVRVLAQMLSTRRTRGHGLFIVLSDLLSGDIPSVCFKRSQGLLTRVAESNAFQAAIFRSAQLFSSQEGAECSSSGPNCLDSLTVSEEFVADVDKFVEVMDGVSDGRFLRGEESELGSDWVELEWLKDKGYYSVEEFVANRLEVAMRLAWLDHGGGNGKKRGVKLKEKLCAVGVAANVYWRKKGCVDWWDNLDSATKRNVFNSVLSKSARHLTGEIMKAASSASEDELLLFNSGEEQSSRYRFTVNARKSVPTIVAEAEFGSSIIPASVSGKPASLSNALNNLIVLRDIVKMIFLCQDGGYDKGKIFFSTLSSICTISDFILRKVRGLLMIISLDCTKSELMAEDKVHSSPVKSKGKGGACSRKKKGRVRNTKTLDPVSRGCEESLNKSAKDMECAISYTEQPELVESKKPTEEPSTAVGVVKAQSSVKKPRRGKGKKRSNGCKDPFQTTSCKRSVVETSSSVISQDELANLASVNLQNLSGGNSANTNANMPISVYASSSSGPIGDDCNTQHISENKGAECYQLNERAAENEPMSSTLGSSKCNADGNVMPSPLHVFDTNGVSNGDRNIEKLEHSRGHDTRSASSNNQVRVFENKEKHVSRQEQDGTYLSDTTPSSSSHSTPYEWPSAASTYFPPRFPHLPHATDRLHLDVSRNWHCHLPQSFKPALHQRNIEGGCNPVLSRQLPMSVDWPPMVRSVCGLATSLTCNYDSGFMPRWNCTYPQGFSNRCMQRNPSSIDEERKHSEDFTDRPDLTSKHELHDELDAHWLSEDEMDIHAVSGVDYNQYFGGGVMYWDPSDRPAGGFSRPPSLSSDDSSWAWCEADMTRAVDDMVSFSSPYSTTGLTSPTAPFCSPFDPLGPGHQAMGYVMGGNEVQAKVLHSSMTVTDVMSDEDTSRSLAGLTSEAEGKTRDCLPYHILPPIIIPNMSRDRSRPEFKSNLDAKSPCLPLTRHEQPRVKRPPSPVVRCVTRAPRPPPPSPVSDSRKHRGFPTVRSGSSSPRHWGMRGWFHDGANLDEACIYRDGAEVFWPSWRNNNFPGNSIIQPLPAALLQDRLIAMSHLARDQEHPDVALPIQPTELQSCPTRKSSLCMMHTLLHDEIDTFCKQVAAQNLARKPYLTWAVKRVTRSLQVLWPRSRTNIFGSNSTGLALPTSDVDLVVCLPPVRNLEPIKEAGILEGRNGIKETCLQHAARYLANQDWVKADSLKTVENTAIPIIMLVVEVPCDLITTSTSNVQSPKEPTHVPGEEGAGAPSDAVISEVLQKSTQMNHDTQKDTISVRLDISFKSPSHTGLQTTELVKKLTEQFPATVPLAMVLKQFLSDRSLDQSYSGGLSSFCLILLITRFLQHQHHLGRPINQNYGSLLMNFLYFFGNVFDPRQMRISVRGSGVYIKRERGCSIDPIHIDDPMFPTNNVGRNCFRIHQCIKAFSEAYSVLENECVNLSSDDDMRLKLSSQLLSKVIPSIGIP